MNRVLIIGGGPTTLEVERWQKYVDNSTVITVSTAYKNPLLRRTKSDYHVVSTQTDFTCKEFQEWYKFNPNVNFIIETNHLWKAPKGMNDFEFNQSQSGIAVEPDFKIGIVGRLIQYIVTEPLWDEVYFVGLDGYAKDGSGQHAYHTEVKKLDPEARYNTYDQYLNNYKNFVKYIETNITDRVKLFNLGKGHPANILSHINTTAFQ